MIVTKCDYCKKEILQKEEIIQVSIESNDEINDWTDINFGIQHLHKSKCAEIFYDTMLDFFNKIIHPKGE